jgi:DNA repair protein RadC
MKEYTYTPMSIQSIKEIPLNQRPREKLQNLGPTALSDIELVTLLLGSGTTKVSVSQLAEKVLGLLDSTPSDTLLCPREIQKIEGIGSAKATLLCAALELGRRRLPSKRKQIIYPADIYPLIRHYGDRPQEHFLCISLNGAHEVLSINVVTIGLVNICPIHPREVLSSAMIQNQR